MEILDLTVLERGSPALTSAMGRAMAEAASVCLQHVGHGETSTLSVSGTWRQQLQLRRLAVDQQLLLGYDDLQEATELGASGVAILLVRKLTGMTVVQRARKGPGFDYWLGPESDSTFQDRARLEISGILRADANNRISTRLRIKRQQTERSDGLGLAAYIVIVEFGGPSAEVEQR